ncbi:MAG: hypothetical protein WCP89_02430 [archaeon]
MALRGLLKKVFGRTRREEQGLDSQETPSPQKPKSCRDVPEVPIFNLRLELESKIAPGDLQDFNYMGNFEATSAMLIKHGAIVTSHGSLRLGHNYSLKTYDAGLELYVDGTPGDVHFDCGHGPHCEYPYRIFRGPEGYKLSVISLGTDAVFFGTDPHIKDDGEVAA